MAVESKVQASTAAAAVSGLALWFLGHYVFKGAVPDVVASWVYVIVPGLVAFAAGYLAPHTRRPVPPIVPPPLPLVPSVMTYTGGMPVSPAPAATAGPGPEPPVAGPPGPGPVA